MTTETTQEKIIPPKEARWYVVHTYSGREERACENLKQRIGTLDVTKYIYDAVVPKQTVVKMTEKGEQKTEQEPMYGGYLLVHMLMPQSHSFMPLSITSSEESDEQGALNARTLDVSENVRALEVLRTTPGIINFISMEDDRDGVRRPVPLSAEEADAMIRGGADDARINFGFEVGDVVTINDGPFNEFSGTVDEVQIEKGTVRVTVSFFGQDTPVELPFTSVERA